MHTAGIPPHITLLQQMQKVGDGVAELRSSVQELPVRMQTGIDRLLEERAVDAGTITAQGLRNTMTAMLQPMLERIDRLALSGGAAVQPEGAAAAPQPARFVLSARAVLFCLRLAQRFTTFAASHT
jgi:hypothetical protein